MYRPCTFFYYMYRYYHSSSNAPTPYSVAHGSDFPSLSVHSEIISFLKATAFYIIIQGQDKLLHIYPVHQGDSDISNQDGCDEYYWTLCNLLRFLEVDCRFQNTPTDQLSQRLSRWIYSCPFSSPWSGHPCLLSVCQRAPRHYFQSVLWLSPILHADV